MHPLARRAVALVECSHAEPVAGVTALTTALAAHAGGVRAARRAGPAVLTGQLFVGWTNDWIDRHRDRAAARTDKPLARGDVGAVTVGVATLAALAATVPLTAACGRDAAIRHGLAVTTATAYNAGLKRTPLSVVAYAVAFAQLPGFISATAPRPARAPRWTVAAAGLLGAGAHFAQALRDVEIDRDDGGRGLPARLGVTRSALAAGALLGAASALTASRLSGSLRTAQLVAGASLAAAVPAAAVAGHRHAAFRTAMLAAGCAAAGFAAGGGFTAVS